MSKLFPDGDDEALRPAHVEEDVLRGLEVMDASLREQPGRRHKLNRCMEMHERPVDGQATTVVIALPDWL